MAALVLLGFVAAACAGQRPFEIDDLFRLQSVGEAFGGPFAFAADGELAFVIRRPRAEVSDYRWEWLAGNAASDVWLQNSPGEPRNLTRGAADGSGWWAPAWSPGGYRLAMLSTRGGLVRLWLHEEGDDAPRLLLDEAVAARGDARHFQWLDDDHLLVETRGPKATSSASQLGLSTPELAQRGWEDMAGGREVTASVLESGVPPERSSAAAGRLLLLDVRDGSHRTLASGTLESVVVSPQKKRLLLGRAREGTPPDAKHPPRWDNDRHVLELRDLDGRVVDPDLARLAFSASPVARWAPDGRRVAVLGENASGHLALYRIDAAEGTYRELPVQSFGGSSRCDGPEPELHWLGNTVIVAGAMLCPDAADTPRRRWVMFDLGDKARRVQAAQRDGVPEVLWPTGDGRLVGLNGRDLVEIAPSGRVRLRHRDAVAADAFVLWPPREQHGDVLPPEPGVAPRVIVMQTGKKGSAALQTVDLASGVATSLPLPDRHAELRARDPRSGALVYVRDDDAGLWAWRAQPHGSPAVRLFRGNRFLHQIRAIDARRFEYQGEGEERLHAWLLRPPSASDDAPLPLLAFVYPGWTAGEELPWAARANVYTHLHVRILLAAGYAVLMPSMPLDRDEREPAARLAGAVLPAVDKLVEEGIADPERLYLMGHSYGGYATLAMVGRTDRFAAAVSLAGASNLIDEYGQFDPRQRYADDAPRKANFGMLWLEDGQGRMFTPPWRDVDRYVRNSPLFQVEDVHTPVLLIQGDLDAVPMEQGEQYFQALYRLGKRARFVRYWGEGHLLRSPANIRDMWEQIFDWLGRFPGT